MDRLSVFATSRDNNFNLIRFGAALGVFISHCFPLSGYSVGGKPQLLGFLSLNVFFIISGFLVTNSYFNNKSTLGYLRARALRVFPALVFSVLWSVFIVGAVFSTLPITEYLRESTIYEYLIKNILLILPSTPDQLPGVFLESKYQPIVNAPLWSLPYEIWCYIILLVLGLISSAHTNMKLFTLITFILFIVSFSIFVANYVLQTDQYALLLGKEAYRLGAMFLMGVCLYLFKEKIRLSHLIAFGIATSIAISALYKPAFVAVFYASFGYLILYLAYIPKGSIRYFNKLGDYSYGIYIFGYPVQQALEQIAPNLSLAAFFIYSFSVTLALAVTSWHLIEKRALAYKA